MRRSHHGIGGWRNDNPRHYRPRGSGTPHFRTGRGFGHGDGSRYQAQGSSGPRHMGPRSYHNQQPNDNMQGDHNRGYHGNRHGSQQRYPDRNSHFHGNQGPRQMYPMLQRMMHEKNSDFHENQNFFDKQNQYSRNMGDNDHRHSAPSNRESFNQRERPPAWVNPPFYEGHSPKKQFRQQDEHGKMPQADYQGHRPPASDHYGGTKASSMDNSKTFSRSVDDTVNIVRGKMLSRESQSSSDTPSPNQSATSSSRQSLPPYQHPPQDQPAKKKSQKLRNIKSNCDKIKNKIVHQLFKMDKDKIHKLMDNPNSSSKFEYAISSLITESQNSYNRHLRSVAEKSLGTSTEFVHNDNNTIYEDTFMKQMQGLLDPQDTVLLEDIKPMVLAELCKVLQLDDIEQRVEYEMPAHSNEQAQFKQYQNEFFDDYDNGPYSPVAESDSYYERKYFGEDKPTREITQKSFRNESITGRTHLPKETIKPDRPLSPYKNDDADSHQEGKPLYERRRKVGKAVESTRSVSPYSDIMPVTGERKTTDYRPDDSYRRSGAAAPVFNPISANPLPEEDDPFAELDEQYHVAVDPTLIGNDYNSSPCQSTSSQPSLTQTSKETPKVQAPEKPLLVIKPQSTLNIKPTDKPPSIIKKEINNQFQDMAKYPLKFIPPHKNEPETSTIIKEAQIKYELLQEIPKPPKQTETIASKSSESVNQEQVPKSTDDTSKKSNNSNSVIKVSTQSDSRKRSIDQRPSHRKEKRKKIDTNSSDSTTNKQILNKNIIINVNDCAKDCTSSENRDAPKSVFNLFFSKEKNSKESSKESKKVDPSDKGYSDKYVKRKESLTLAKKSKDSSHSIMSPTDTSGASAQTPTKTETPVKLKPIDMFVEQPKKAVVVHQAPRNTAPVSLIPHKPEARPIIISRKLTRRHVATQVVQKILTKEVQTDESKTTCTRFCQTDRKRVIARGSQTDIQADFALATSSKPADPYERMKQIDMEIQTLLQEKFKLYNSLENQDACSSTMQSLGMAVLNPVEADVPEETLSEDTIIEEFTNIPMEELENIAFESVVNTVQESVVNTVQESVLNTVQESVLNTVQESVLNTVPECVLNTVQESVNAVEENQTLLERRSRRQKTVDREITSSQSPASIVSVRSKRKSKTPNISLIEQIITDDRPLEDIISLDDLEVSPQQKKTPKTPVKPKKKGAKNQKEKTLPAPKAPAPKEPAPKAPAPKEPAPKAPAPKASAQKTPALKAPAPKTPAPKAPAPKTPAPKAPALKTPAPKPPAPGDDIKRLHGIKECSVVLIRKDIKKMLLNLKKSGNAKSLKDPGKPEIEPQSDTQDKILDTPETEQIIEEVVNDIDMLDVSEDIVIGDEGKPEKEADSSNPDVIVDNSQSLVEGSGSGREGEYRVFDYSSDENLRRDTVTVTGNGDAVLAIECIENNFIAACLDGNVYYFNGDGQLLNTLRGSNLAVTCLTIVKERNSTTVYTGSLDSRIRYYDLETGLEKGPECNVLSPIQTMDRAWGTIFVGTRTGFVLQFECKNNMLIPVSTVKFSDQSMLSIRAMKEGPRKVLLVAARSEPVTIRDAQTGLLLRTLEGPKMTVYTLLFEDGKVYCGTSSHQIHVFEYVTGSHIHSHSGGKGAVCLRARGGLVFAGCYDGCVYVYRDSRPAPLALLRGPSLMLLSLAVHSTKIIAGYKDRSLYIWKIPFSLLQEMVL